MDHTHASNSKAVETETEDNSNMSLHSEAEIVNTPNVTPPPSVLEIVDVSNALSQSVTDIVETKEPILQCKEIINTENVTIPLSANDIQSEVATTSYVPLPQSISDVVDIINATSHHAATDAHRLNVPSPQPESEVVDTTTELEPVNNLNVLPCSDDDETSNEPLPQSVTEVFDTTNVPLIQSTKPEVMNTLDASFNQTAKPEPVDILPTLQSINSELTNNLNVPEVEKPKLIEVLNFSPSKSESIVETLKVSSAHSIISNSSKLVETLNVPTMKAVRNAYRKTKFDAIFDSDDDDDDTRTKLDASLVEHTSVMRGAIPVLPIALAYFCLMCNVLVPGLGTIFSGMFCLCFGIPRFGVHDGAKHRIGALLINLLVGCGQLFTVLFCLVGWGWSVWWGVIMVKIARKYRKLKAEAMADEAEAPPVTANNHTRA